MLRSLPVISARSDQTNERSCGLSQEENSHRELSLSPPLPPAGRRQGPHRIQVSHPIAFHALEEQRDGTPGTPLLCRVIPGDLPRDRLPGGNDR